MIKTLLKSLRISWSSKTVNMFLLALTYAYFSNTIIGNPLQILEGLLLVCALWGALYSLNDLTDLKSDRKNPEKQDRAFIQEKIQKKWIVTFIVSLLLIIFLVSFTLNINFTIILVLMVINQILYTVPPIRLKETKLAPFVSTANNSVLRIAACCVLLGNIFLVPLSVYIFMYTASMATYLMYKGIPKVASLVGFLTGVILIYILYTGEINLIQLAVAVLPAAIAGIPLYLSLFFDKVKMARIADILYHQVALVFFLIAIFYILFI
ncbi:MAG TPA: UbiA family prenyltransferase [Methanobacterium sp.]|nr:UbiA family prenyltransferase [Methanobacterium sp.]